MAFKSARINPVRLCVGLSAIGYTPSSAICDIIDNSVQWHGRNVHVIVQPKREAPDTRLNNVKEYLVIDDGTGMTPEGADNALALGSEEDYKPQSLSKFGLGLKSASLSQGELLEIVTSTGDGVPFSKYSLSMSAIRERLLYGYEDAIPLSDEDIELTRRYLPDGRGTIIRIGQIHENNHPSIRATLTELRTKAGAIYFYKMRDGGLRLHINGEECKPFDVLFTHEADTNGTLDENSWDGRSTRWIEKPRTIVLDAQMDVEAQIEVTQLPHPPTFDLEGAGKQKEIRDKYNIGAGNYGFYVYRNGRLLSWAESFGIIPQDQDFYAFRGRILIDDAADRTFNIDVKKSDIHLSDEAFKVLDDRSAEYKRKSKKAWKHAKEEIQRRTGETGLAHANSLAQQATMPEEVPGTLETESEYEEAERREQEIVETNRRRLQELLDSELNEGPRVKDDGSQIPSTPPSAEEQIAVAVGGPSALKADKIFAVTNTEDNVLWEPYYDTDKGVCVRLNRMHRFHRVVYEDNASNSAMQTLVGLLFLQLAGAENYVQRSLQKYPRRQIEDILAEFRRVSTDYLAKMCRDLGDMLPSE